MDATTTFFMAYIFAQMILISLHVTMSPSMSAQHISIIISEFCNNLIAFFIMLTCEAIP